MPAESPEYVARAWRRDRRPSRPVVLHPEDMLRDEVEALDRRRMPPLAESPIRGAIEALFAH